MAGFGLFVQLSICLDAAACTESEAGALNPSTLPQSSLLNFIGQACCAFNDATRAAFGMMAAAFQWAMAWPAGTLMRWWQEGGPRQSGQAQRLCCRVQVAPSMTP